MLALALSSYISLYPVLLLPPLVLLCHDQQPQGRAKSLVQTTAIALATFASALTTLIFLSYLQTGNSWEFLSSTYGVQLLLPDLTPNVGLWWYFFIEMFDSFREFFLGVFWLHLVGYVGGFSFRMR
jgi:GPI-anchor transamidase subunit U